MAEFTISSDNMAQTYGRLVDSEAAEMLQAGADPADILFQCLPDPRTHPYPLLAAEAFEPFDEKNVELTKMLRGETKPITFKYYCAINCFADALELQHSSDPDAELLRPAAEAFSGKVNPMAFIGELASLALKKAPGTEHTDSDVTYKKSEHLAYYKWLALGAKDQDNPFNENPKAKKPASNKHIPGSLFSTKCGMCGKSGASHNCDKCLVRKDGRCTFRQAYCNKSCKTQHSSLHEAACKEIQRLERTTSMFTDLLVNHLALTNYHELESISKKDGLVVNTLANLEPKAYTGGSAFHRFPGDLAPSHEVAISSLMAIQHTECLDNVEDLLETFFLGLRVEKGLGQMFRASVSVPLVKMIERVTVLPKNVDRPVTNMRADKNDIVKRFTAMENHELIRITTVSGIVLAFDPTGAQFGWSELITPWLAYAEHRIACVIGTGSPNGLRRAGKGPLYVTRYGSGPGAQLIDILMVRGLIMTKMIPVLNTELAKGGGMYSILNWEEEEFSVARDHIIKACKGEIYVRATDFLSGPVNKFFMNSFLLPEIPENPEAAEKLKRVWLHPNLYDRLKDEPADLHQLWFTSLQRAGLYQNLPGTVGYPIGSSFFN